MWTANIQSIVTSGTAGIATMLTKYSHTDGRTVIINDNLSDPTSYAKIITDKINDLTRIDAINNLIANPPLGLFTPPVIPPQTQADIDLNNFSKWMQLTMALNAAKQLGWVVGTEQIILDAKAKVLALAVTNIPKLFS